MERFWEKVDKTGDCWEWTAAKDQKGYGVFDGNWKAHRFAWELAVGKIPHQKCVCHRCDNPGCVNPEHLFIGSQAENMADKKAKGRAMKYLDEFDVAIIKLLFMSGMRQADIAREFDISRQRVHDLVVRYGQV